MVGIPSGRFFGLSWFVDVLPAYFLRFKMLKCALNIPNNPRMGTLQIIFTHSLGIHAGSFTAMVAFDVMDCGYNGCFC